MEYLKNSVLKMSICLTLCLITTFGIKANADAASMHTSDNGVELIKSFEGFSAFQYWDVSQYSIGYGSKTYNGEFPNGISELQATILLKNQLGTYEGYVNSFLSKYNITVNQNQFDALVSFTYNLGNVWGGSFLLKNYLINGVNNYSEDQIRTAFGNWVYANNVKLEGLVIRRNREASLFLSESGEESMIIPEHSVDSRFPGNISAYPLATSGRIILYNSSGIAYNINSRYIDYQDLCVINEIYTDGFCKVTYPSLISPTGKNTEYARTNSFFKEYGTLITYSPSTNINVYKRSDMSDIFGSAWTTDQCFIVYESGNPKQIIYPLDSGGYKLGWINDPTQSADSDHLPVASKIPEPTAEDIPEPSTENIHEPASDKMSEPSAEDKKNGEENPDEFDMYVIEKNKCSPPGDINGDGKTNNKDLTRLAQYLTGWDVDVKEGLLDVNGDDSVNNKDLTRLFQYLTGHDVEIFGDKNEIIVDSFVYGKSVNGRDLVCYSITPAQYDRTILLEFEIHGFEDEYDHDGQVLVDTANALLRHYSEVTDLNKTRLFIIPSANPDGLLDGNTNNGFGRCNADGVDLNRDFDANYSPNLVKGRNYTPYAFSAPESRALRDLYYEYRPDIVIDFHGWLNMLIGDEELKNPFHEILGLDIATSFTNTNAKGYFTNWAHQQGSLAMLVEFVSSDDVDISKLIRAVDRLIYDSSIR